MLTYPHIDPVALHLGPYHLPIVGTLAFDVRWYALAYLMGVLLGWMLVGKLNKRLSPRTLSPLAFDDIMVWAILGIILGGRFGYVFFYKPGFYFAHPKEILKVWEGGMSFHGGLLGVIVAMACFARKFKIPFLAITDLMAAVAPIGLLLGRLANFVNGELYGRPTGSALGMIFPSDPYHVARYPSQLFEAGLEGAVLFVALITIATRSKALERTGLLSGLFLIGYCIARTTCELFREPDEFIHFLPHWITMGQLLSMPMLLLGLYLALRRQTLPRFRQFLHAASPMTVAGYMGLCNEHYYATRDPLGAAGDFTTAPEISQIFGEIIGAWTAERWVQLDRPKALLVELGPGRGTLMKDALRGTKSVEGFHAALDIRLVETSPVLKVAQQGALSDYNVRWQETLEKLPPLPLLLIANEFFDALPVEQFTGDAERKVVFDKGAVRFTPDGKVTRESSQASQEVMKRIAAHIHKYGGAALIVDYGYAKGESGDTLQAVKRHNFTDPLAQPGEADLTAHVDFAALAETAKQQGAYAHAAIGQGTFLKRLGAELRAQALCRTATPEQRQALLSGLERLVAPHMMGELFKVLAVTSGVEAPAGF